MVIYRTYELDTLIIWFYLLKVKLLQHPWAFQWIVIVQCYVNHSICNYTTTSSKVNEKKGKIFSMKSSIFS